MVKVAWVDDHLLFVVTDLTELWSERVPAALLRSRFGLVSGGSGSQSQTQLTRAQLDELDDAAGTFVDLVESRKARLDVSHESYSVRLDRVPVPSCRD